MPSRDEHLRQAQHNLEFSESLDPGRYSDWIATGLFYSALHYVDAFLATKSIHPGRHDVRDDLMTKVAELKLISNAYWALKNSSRTARYYTPPRFSQTHLRRLRESLEEIRRSLRAHIPIP
jgi:uncharacterized protein (UPF0332 family)